MSAKKFKKELRELMLKYKVGVHEVDNYNQHDYCGSTVYLTFKDDNSYEELEVIDVLNECKK